MIKELVDNLIKIKQDFAQNYTGNAHIQEILPLKPSKEFPIDTQHLEQLHLFAQKNPIYLNSFEKNILDFPCIVYEGDINEYCSGHHWPSALKEQRFQPYDFVPQ